MMQATTEPLRIGAIGLDPRQCNALRMVFDGVCRKAYRFVENTTPEAWIVDLDHVGVADVLAAEWGAQGGRPTLFLSLNRPDNVSIGGTTVHGLHLRKPFRIDDFVALLPALADAARRAAPVVPPARERRIDAGRIAVARESSRAADLLNDEMSHGLVGNAEDIDLDDAAQRGQIYYAPERFLQGRLERAWRRARDAGQAMAVEGPWPTFVLFPAENRVQLAAAARHYRPFAIVPDLQGECREVLLGAQRKPADDSIPYPAFLWKLSLWAARGRLPSGTPIDVPVYLRWWPNFTRLDVSPSALAIAALWSREPHSLAGSPQVLGIPQRRVFAFYSAAKAIELADVSHRAVDRMTERQPLPAAGKPQGFLGRLLQKMRVAN